ncbi:PTS system system cellobiose-specific transporter subunit IIC [Streptococcus pneumoniae]|nr:PTS system system cellobiose-specific transporter subunit IIC [Streptococcus pneumoniae]VTJ08752.1 PTS system system cellobiose-specific transporter subunit IIC [Streptococcus pneumoniae]
MPLYILAGLIVLLNNTVFKWIFQGDTLTRFQYWGITIANGTLSISGMIIAVMVGYFLAKNRDFENPLAASMLSLVSLIVMMPNTVSVVPDGAKDAVNISGVLSFNNTGTGAMFAGVIVAIIATELFIELSNVKALQMNLGENIPPAALQMNLGENIPPAVSRSFSVLLPVMTVISLFGVVSALLFNITGMNLISIITIFIQEPIRHIGTSLIGVIIIYSLGNMLWLFGIHQAVIYSAILEPLLLINITENITAANNGQAIPYIINLSQIQTFALMGGSGSTLCLLIATFLVSRNAVSKNVAKLSFGPGIFNINEPVLFGYPIVYNISLAIPFITVPVLGILISYLATVTGFMSPAFIQVPWTTPVFLNAWLATAGDVRAVLVQFIIFALGVLLYIPFIKVNDKVVEQEMEG